MGDTLADHTKLLACGMAPITPSSRRDTRLPACAYAFRSLPAVAQNGHLIFLSMFKASLFCFLTGSVGETLWKGKLFSHCVSPVSGGDREC